MANSLLLGLLLAASAPRQAIPSPVAGYEGVVCIPGFCPRATPRRVPGGAMYLALGLVLVGVAGLRRGSAES